MDLKTAFHSVIYAGRHMNCKELITLREIFGGVLGKKFVKESDEDKSCLHKIVSKALTKLFSFLFGSSKMIFFKSIL